MNSGFDGHWRFFGGTFVATYNFFPAFARNSDESGRLAGLLESGVDAVLLLVLPLSLLVGAFSRELLRAWLGPAFAAAGGPVLAWLSAGLLLNGLAKVPSTLIQAIGRPDITGELFGSLIVVDSRQLDVTQDSVDSIDGVYSLRSPAFNFQLQLYREAAGVNGTPDRISGFESWQFGGNGLIAASQGHFDAAEYVRQLEHGVRA